MRVKLLTFKPNKNGDVTLYLGAGVDLRELIDLIGQEVIIEPAAGKEEKPVDDGLQAIIAMIQDYGEAKYRIGIDDKTINAIEGFTSGDTLSMVAGGIDTIKLMEEKEGTGNE